MPGFLLLLLNSYFLRERQFHCVAMINWSLSCWPLNPDSSFPTSWELELKVEAVWLVSNQLIYLFFNLLSHRNSLLFCRCISPTCMYLVLQNPLWAILGYLGCHLLLTTWLVITFSWIHFSFLHRSAPRWNICFLAVLLTMLLGTQLTSLTTKLFRTIHHFKWPLWKKILHDLLKWYNHLIN